LIWRALFWLFAVTILYVYIGYPLLLSLARKARRVRPTPPEPAEWPRLSMVIAARNEEQSISAKLENTLSLHYPPHLLEVLVVSDASSDATDGIVAASAGRGVRLIRTDTHRGKTAAQNLAALHATGEILVFSDATGMYDRGALRSLARWFVLPDVGAVCGRVAWTGTDESTAARGHSIYWRYERWIRNAEDRAGSTMVASGSIYAIRRDHYVPLSDAAQSDLIEPLCQKLAGRKVVYEPGAVSREAACTDYLDEYNRKRRIVIRGLKSLSLYPEILDVRRHPLLAWEITSHKLLRWSAPFLLCGLLIVCVPAAGDRALYWLAAAAQVCFYLLGALGAVMRRTGRDARLPFLSVPLYFLMANAAAAAGIVAFLRGEVVATWQPSRQSKSGGSDAPRDRH
jgi:glycosyltransferase involved in cell wall biosynthesis